MAWHMKGGVSHALAGNKGFQDGNRRGAGSRQRLVPIACRP